MYSSTQEEPEETNPAGAKPSLSAVLELLPAIGTEAEVLMQNEEAIRGTRCPPPPLVIAALPSLCALSVRKHSLISGVTPHY